jgi:UDP-N-acetylglucosamine--N-acetylmuramyl-(pentapeptide) pyrophosphoryl-undecaprenol N-acetylglucosamine transferase
LRLVVTAGGTGGHVYPALAVAAQIQEIPGSTVEFIGSINGPEGDAAGNAGLNFMGLQLTGLVGKDPLTMLRSLWLFSTATLRCRKYFARSRPDCVVGTGGYAAAPACVAAAWLKIPLVLHEMNLRPGLVTRILSRRAQVVAVAFERTITRLPAGTRVEVTGVPVRREIEELAIEKVREKRRAEAIETFSLESGRKTLLVFGGSQGALALNKATWDALLEISDRTDIQVLHLVGRDGFSSEQRRSADRSLAGAGLLYRSMAYCDRMQDAYSLADLVVARAGAGTVAELMATGVPAVLVPYPHATAAHQAENARELESLGAVRVVLQEGESASRALHEALKLLDDDFELQRMHGAFGAMSSAPGAKGIACIVEELTLGRSNR